MRRLNHGDSPKGLVGSSFGFPLVSSAGSSHVQSLELGQHPAQAREASLFLAVDGEAGVGDCNFQDPESLLKDRVDGVQFLRHLGIYELSQCLEVELNRPSLIFSNPSFGEESGQQVGGDLIEGVKFLPELSWLLVGAGEFAGLHQDLIVQIADDSIELPVVFKRDGRNSTREGEEVVRVGVELDALVLRVGLEASSLQDRGKFGVEECQSFVRVHDCSWLLDRVLFAFGLACVFCFVVGKENGNTLVESFTYPTFGGKGVTASTTKC